MTTSIQILLIALAWLFASPAFAQTLSGHGTAVIDGVIDNAEWADADAPIFLVNRPGGGSPIGAALYVMNDATNLYLGFVILYLDDLIDVSLAFDASGDGQTGTVGDDSIGFATMTNAVRDNFVGPSTADFDTNGGGTLDVVAATSTTTVSTYIEMSHPLRSGDTGHDIDVGPGDLLAFYAQIRLFPCCTDSFYPGPVAGIEAQIQIVPEATSGSAAALVVLFGFARSRRLGAARRSSSRDLRLPTSGKGDT